MGVGDYEVRQIHREYAAYALSRDGILPIEVDAWVSTEDVSYLRPADRERYPALATHFARCWAQGEASGRKSERHEIAEYVIGRGSSSTSSREWRYGALDLAGRIFAGAHAAYQAEMAALGDDEREASKKPLAAG